MATSKVTTKQTQTRKGSADYSARSGHSESERKVSQKMAAYSKQLANNPEAARDFLLSAGIITTKGNLRKVFGG